MDLRATAPAAATLTGSVVATTAATAPPEGPAPTRGSRWREVLGVASIAVQLGISLLLARAFHIENAAFYGLVLPVLYAGFVVHHWLPRRLQAWFFVALSLGGIGLVLGPEAGAWLVGVGLALIALCHVPVAYRWRVLLVLAAAGALLAMRSAWLPAPWPRAMWPILGSMFMFRLGLYLYDLKHETKPASPAVVLAYFFMLPNTVFLLFPVIDWQTFRRTWFDKPALEIYAEGVRWIYRGLPHLLAYRLIYSYVVITPADVTSTAGIVQYLVANFGLYLRVSGQFHIIVGLLHLFGFRLPETHRFFYLASSFTDLWRRINIYWKDFMQKTVYLPVFFALRRHAETTRLVVATIVVVVATWFLHSWQWFWLLGRWLFTATDAAFWAILGVFLILSTLAEQRRGRVRQLGRQTASTGRALRVSLQTAGMFCLMATLWGLWTLPSFEDFRVLWSAATLRSVDVALVLGVVGLVFLAAWLSQRFALGAPSALGLRRRWQHPLLVSALPLGLFWMAGEDWVEGRVPARLQTVAREARAVELNSFDAQRLQRGYYEEIVGVNRFNGELWEIYARAEEEQQPELEHEGLGGFQDDGYGNRCFKPNVTSVFKGGGFSTNRWGLRDKDYAKLPDDATWRLAVMGASNVMGAGVNDGEPFECLIEDRLNGEWFPRAGMHYELLNFGLPQAALTEVATIVACGRVAEFKPNGVLVVGNWNWEHGVATHLWKVVKSGKPLPPTLLDALPGAALPKATSEAELTHMLVPHTRAVARWALNTMAQATRDMGALPIYVLMPMPRDPAEFSGKSQFLDLAREAGYVVIDMQDVFQGHPVDRLVLTNADYHPNAEGHRILAARLYAEMQALPGILPAER